MKINRNPIIWFLITGIAGYLFVANNAFEDFIVFAVAVIIAKQIETLNEVSGTEEIKGSRGPKILLDE